MRSIPPGSRSQGYSGRGRSTDRSRRIDSEKDEITTDEPLEPSLLPPVAELSPGDQGAGIVEACLSEVQDYYDQLQTIVNGVPASRFSNVDETGYQEWANHREQRVIVPAGHPGDVIDILFNRSTN
jgi:hypothetical protein